MVEVIYQLSTWHWLSMGIIFIILEMISPGFYLLWFGIAAFLVGLLLSLFPEMSWKIQVFLFSILSIVSVYIGQSILKKQQDDPNAPVLNQRAAQYIGRTFTLVNPIIDQRGSINVDDTIWRIAGEDAEIGTKIKITGIDGTLLTVDVLS